jgi:hypothetical protein
MDRWNERSTREADDPHLARSAQRRRTRRERGREEVLGAILLASRGTYSVLIANLPGARSLVRELEDEASRNNVALLVEDGGDGRVGLRVTRA